MSELHDTRAAVVPHTPECEAAVLSLLAQWPDSMQPCLAEQQVDEHWFHLPGHRALYLLLTGELSQGRRLDFLTLATRSRDLGIEPDLAFSPAAEAEYGAAAIGALFRFLPSGLNSGYYFDELREKFLARELLAVCRDTQRLIAADWQAAGIPLVRQTLARLTDLASYGVRNDTVHHIRPAVMEAVEKVQVAFNARGSTLGLPTGIHALDRCINGIKKAHGYYIGGRPAMGKSAIMGDIVDFIGSNPDPFACAQCLVFSIEMTTLQLVQRSLMKAAGIPQQRVRDGLMSEDRDFPKLGAAALALGAARIHVDDTSTLTIDELCARTRRFVRKVRAGETPEQRAAREKSDRPDVVVFLDYLQRCKGSSKRGRENRYLEIAEICQAMSALIKELGIAAVVVVQLGRAENEGPDRFPSLSDMRESGDIEAEAHVVIAMHRPDYYCQGADKKDKWCAKHSDEQTTWNPGCTGPAGLGQRDLAHLAYAVVLKQREGPVGELMVHFEPCLAKFSDWNPNETAFSTNSAHRQAVQGELPK